MFGKKTTSTAANRSATDPETRILDVPAGPGTGPELDPGVLRHTAEQEGIRDAAAYDTDSLLVNTPFPYELELEHQRAQAEQDSIDGQQRAQQVADDIVAGAAATLVAADGAASTAQATATDTATRRSTLHTTLTQPGPWHDPDRVHEPVWKSVITSAWVPTLAAAFEGGLNYAVLLGFNMPQTETIALAAVFSVLGVLVPHMAGVRARKFRGQTTRQARWARWGLPTVGMLLLILVQGMLAGLRTGFLDAPQIDPTTGAQQPSLLSGLGVPAWLLLIGWWAVQIAISLVVAWHAEHTHNPFVAAHRRSVRADNTAQAALTQARAGAEQARLALDAAHTNRDRVTTQFQAQRDRYRALTEQALQLYGRAMARAKADPAFTSAMEDRLHRHTTDRNLTGLTDTTPTRLERVS